MNQPQPLPLQQQFWNRWNATTREKQRDEISKRQARVVTGWLGTLARTDLDIIEVGCGAGWFCEQLVAYGKVTATDLSDAVLARAQERLPDVRFVTGDFMALDFPIGGFDVVVSLEVLSHIADQHAFVAKLARLLRPGGQLMLATQNRVVLERYNRIPDPQPGQLRNWVDKHELAALLAPYFTVEELFSVTPRANRGFMHIVNSARLNRPIQAVAGDRIERMKEAMGLGWTLMVRARKPPL